MNAPLQLFDPRLGEPALRVGALGGGPGGIPLEGPWRFNYFTVVWVRRGRGTFGADASRHAFEGPVLLFGVPYQAVRVDPCGPIEAVVIQFHPNFFCVETYHEEVGCNGVLFNAGCGVPLVRVDADLAARVAADVDALRGELADAGLAHGEALVSHLKLLLIRATRAKLAQQPVDASPPPSPSSSQRRLRRDRPPAVLDDLRRLVESRFRELRRPGGYARLLHVAPTTLAKIAKAHLGTTVTALIRERVMRQAKWELLHTLKPVKEVAAELGFDDVFYFSRAFKRAAGCSPTFFRDYETAIRGGRNLSMGLRDPSIPAPSGPAND